jgi:precorrin-4 methylase
MRKLLILTLLVLLPALPGLAAAKQGGPWLRVTGLVDQPLRLSLADLSRLASARVKYNDMTSNGKFRGVFWLQGVPLRSLLELAQVNKPGGGFSKRVDLALLVRDRHGRQVALSWGEVFYRNPAEAVLAVEAEPVMPHKDCAACHTPEEYQPRLKQLKRKVGLPKLVLTGDSVGDRALEEVVSIEVVDPLALPEGPRPKKLYAPSLTIKAAGGKAVTLKKLPALPRLAVLANQFGEGKGFHGSHRFAGVSLASLLRKLGFQGGPNTVYVISAPDHYRSLVSWGELFLGPLGRRIIVADRLGGKPMEQDGRFQVVLPDDLWADRWVKAAAFIQAVDLKPRARLYVIGMGCGEVNLITLEALDYLNRAQVLVAPADIQRRFASLLAGKPVLFDPMAFGKKPFNPQGAHKDKKARHLRGEEQKKAAGLIQAQLAKGKSVALLDWGDPMVYGSWRWLGDYFPKGSITFVPGLSAFNAGSAALGRDITCHGAVAISDPFTLLKDPSLAQALAAKGATLAIFMGLPKFDQVMKVVQKAYPSRTPATVVFKAGFGPGQRVVRGRLDQMDKLTQSQREKWLGVIFVGPCLQ